jgi:hypothetical protein
MDIGLRPGSLSKISNPVRPGAQRPSDAPCSKGAECRLVIQRFDAKRKESSMLNIGYNGIVGLLILVGDVWAIINIFQSSASNEKKLLWILVVLLLPLLGLILWFFLGPRGGKT